MDSQNYTVYADCGSKCRLQLDVGLQGPRDGSPLYEKMPFVINGTQEPGYTTWTSQYSYGMSLRARDLPNPLTLIEDPEFTNLTHHYSNYTYAFTVTSEYYYEDPPDFKVHVVLVDPDFQHFRAIGEKQTHFFISRASSLLVFQQTTLAPENKGANCHLDVYAGIVRKNWTAEEQLIGNYPISQQRVLWWQSWNRPSVKVLFDDCTYDIVVTANFGEASPKERNVTARPGDMQYREFLSHYYPVFYPSGITSSIGIGDSTQSIFLTMTIFDVANGTLNFGIGHPLLDVENASLVFTAPSPSVYCAADLENVWFKFVPDHEGKARVRLDMWHADPGIACVPLNGYTSRRPALTTEKNYDPNLNLLFAIIFEFIFNAECAMKCRLRITIGLSCPHDAAKPHFEAVPFTINDAVAKAVFRSYTWTSDVAYGVSLRVEDQLTEIRLTELPEYASLNANNSKYTYAFTVLSDQFFNAPPYLYTHVVQVRPLQTITRIGAGTDHIFVARPDYNLLYFEAIQLTENLTAGGGFVGYARSLHADGDESRLVDNFSMDGRTKISALLWSLPVATFRFGSGTFDISYEARPLAKDTLWAWEIIFNAECTTKCGLRITIGLSCPNDAVQPHFEEVPFTINGTVVKALSSSYTWTSDAAYGVSLHVTDLPPLISLSELQEFSDLHSSSPGYTYAFTVLSDQFFISPPNLYTHVVLVTPLQSITRIGAGADHIFVAPPGKNFNLLYFDAIQLTDNLTDGGEFIGYARSLHADGDESRLVDNFFMDNRTKISALLWSLAVATFRFGSATFDILYQAQSFEQDTTWTADAIFRAECSAECQLRITIGLSCPYDAPAPRFERVPFYLNEVAVQPLLTRHTWTASTSYGISFTVEDLPSVVQISELQEFSDLHANFSDYTYSFTVLGVQFYEMPPDLATHVVLFETMQSIAKIGAGACHIFAASSAPYYNQIYFATIRTSENVTIEDDVLIAAYAHSLDADGDETHLVDIFSFDGRTEISALLWSGPVATLCFGNATFDVLFSTHSSFGLTWKA
ncbi:unnamed protein product, partial [Mesorhabditis spiculigera]